MRKRLFNAKSWHCRDPVCNRWPRTRSPTRPANVPNARPPSRTASLSRRSSARQGRPQTKTRIPTSPCSARCRTRQGTASGSPFILSPTQTKPQFHHTSLLRKLTPSTLRARMLWAAAGAGGRTPWRSTSAWICASRRNVGRNTPVGVSEPRHAVPRGTAANRPAGWWGVVARCLLLCLTCAERNHGSQQQQAAFAALRARSQAVHNTDNMKPEPEALWSYRLFDIYTVSPVLWDPTPPSEAGASMIGSASMRRKATSASTRGCGWTRSQWSNFRSMATPLLTPPGSLPPSASSGPIFGVLKPMSTATFELYSPHSRQHRRRNRHPRSLCPCSTRLHGHREDEQAKDRTCWDQLAPLPFQTGAGKSSPTSSTWPWQLLGTSIMLKPKTDNTNRPLGLLSMMVRIWEKIRQRPMQARCRESAGPWDQVVERSPALRCALIRCAVAEAASECGMDAALTMAHLEKFYDTTRIDHLVNMALSLQAPARVLLINLLAYLAPGHPAVSDWLYPWVSIVQGSRSSNKWAHVLLLDVLERAQAHVPWVYPYQWVDDINLLAIDTQKLTEIHSPRATLELLAGPRNKGLRISPKSQIVASRPVPDAWPPCWSWEVNSSKLLRSSISREAAPTVASSIANAHVRPPSGRAASASSRNTRGQRSGCAQPVSSQVLPTASPLWAHPNTRSSARAAKCAPPH